MSLQIETVGELQKLLDRTGIKPTSVEELRGLLQTINREYNPDAGRMRVARRLATVPPAVSIGVAGGLSFYAVMPILASGPHGADTAWIAIPLIAIMWGIAGIVSVLSVLSAWLVVRSGRPRGQAGVSYGEHASEGRPLTGIMGANQFVRVAGDGE